MSVAASPVLTSEATLLEPSFADLLEVIAKASDLPERKRSHWTCSLRQIAHAMNKPPGIIPARWTAVRFPIERLHHARVGANPKTLANHKSNVRAALLWFSQETEAPRRGTPLTPAWQVLHQRIADTHTRRNLSPLMRYCSARRIGPAAVDEAVLDGYMRYRAETTALASGDAARRGIARAWNRCADAIADWPARLLLEPAIKTREGAAWTEFPEGLRTDIERYLDGLTGVRRSAKGKRIRPCKPSTIRRCHAELVATARMAVRLGTPIESLTSLGALLDPVLVERVLESYWPAATPEPSTYAIELSGKLVSIARETGCLDSEAIERLDDLRASLELHRRGGMTDKNLAVIRQVLSGTIWQEVINLPKLMMAQARADRGHSPTKAAVTAQIAVAIAILTVAPVRLGNLIRIRLDENLIKPGGPDCPYMLVFPRYDVKNRVQLQFELDAELSALIDEYVHDFRSTLLRGSNEPWLFPGEDGGFKGPGTFSAQITQRIDKATGLRLTVHQFRHAAAAILLKHRPGEYELVRQLLGHRNVQTTIQFYCALETMQATKIFGDIVRKQLRFGPDLEAQ